MRPDFDYSNTPINFAHCFMTECQQFEQCMRAQATKVIPDKEESIAIVNPTLVRPQSDKCPYYLADKTVRFALGLTHLFDAIEYATAKRLKKEIIAYFNHTVYYRCWRKERLITPAEQAYIRSVFRRYGVDEEPSFDEYVERYEWESINLSLQATTHKGKGKRSSY
jgi:hypothetical protein